jgi:tRNA-splicing ligase RtcB (3'-phosphate/5'-hydroxy nucleic acid ligase)
MEQIGPRLRSWASILDPATREQALTTSSLPFIHPHVALMPDAHLGKGATVGSVLPTLGAIIPAAVGVDIGCGMIALRTQLSAQDLPSDRRAVRVAVEKAVPLSAGHHNRKVSRGHTSSRVADLEQRAEAAGVDPDRYARNWRLQLGTLGSGNHFIEISLDEQDRVWLFLHSGSRGVGNKMAQHHIEVAQRTARQKGISVPNRDLAYLVEGTGDFAAYLRDLGWAQHFALLNREEMMDRLVTCVEEWVGQQVVPSETVNAHHNYTARERHFGKDVWLSRKGAIDAGKGVPGLIPGSMGTRSYVVVGKGNAEALDSAPHGAGRQLSRAAARRTFSQADLRAAMGDIEYRDTDAFVDEIPGAYKDIDVVMRDAADLVEVRHTLRQVVNVKGD